MDDMHPVLPEVSRVCSTGNLKSDLERAVQAVGGWGWLHDDDTVLVKPNMRRTFITGGPATGDLREPGILFASHNRVALDIEAMKVIQGYPGHNLPVKVEEVVQIRRAIDLGLGPEEGLSYRTVAI